MTAEGPASPAAGEVHEVRVHPDHGRGYPVLVGTGLLERVGAWVAPLVAAHRWCVISDETVAGLHGDRVVDSMAAAGLPCELLTFPAGERHKTRATWGRLSDRMLEAGHGRDSAVVALGGGVVGDLAGFVAATFMRGIPVVQVPTSTVAMIDASVGGKTGVDTPVGKNLLGAFHPPRAVLADVTAAHTLTRGLRAQGLVEAVKHGAVLDGAYFAALVDAMEALLEGRAAALVDAVRRSVELKAGVVSADEREAGYRKILNFGHTVGHALEASSGYRLSHGAAVGIGMIVEARAGERSGVTESGTSEQIERAVEALGMPTRSGQAWAGVRAFLASDKKRERGTPRFVLLRKIGQTDPGDGWVHDVPEAVLEDAYRSVAMSSGEREEGA